MESPRGGVDGEGDHSPSPEAARMLHEMALRKGGELDLTDEQLRSNDQLQQDEMLALEAIYGENLEVFGETSVPRSFQIHVHCEIPDGISVSAELLQGVDDYPNNWLTFSVEHLAPISLTCLMPPSYPSHQPPYFTLGIQWLDRAKVFSLCHMLDSIWAQQPGQEVVFEWVQWLQSSMLSHLGFDGRIIIRQSDRMMDHVDVRAVGDILSVEEIVERLISYNEEQCHETFLRGIHVCTICLHEYTAVLWIPILNQCSLFESEQCKIDREKLRVNVEVNDVVKKMQKDLRLTLSRAHPCSNCHQPNFKVGNNNHIFCGTCQVHYCALCQKRVYKSTEHYGPRGCKQHTSDLEFA
ncbi:hypothetical protein ACQ4PT_035228 [Festuca glaucescens]